jgi:glycosyltransferase involved in cell wall biosynthesis
MGWETSLLTSANYPKEQGIDLTIVVPVYNEDESVDQLFSELKKELSTRPYRWEAVFIDDGSSDASLDRLLKIHQANDNVVLVSFRRNFGQTAALSAGFDFANGDIIVTMDGDLQNDPADITKLLAKLDEGYDIASGWRYFRKDSWLSRKLPSKIANSLISRMTGVKLHDYGCTLKAYRREVIKNIRLYGELHRFVPALANERGARVAEIKVNHRARQFGQSKYNISRTSRVLLDLATVKFLLDYRTKPLQLFGKLGLLGFFLGGLMFAAALAMKLLVGQDLTGNPMLVFSLFLFTAGIQLISIGLVGELVTRSYYETQGKPIYVVKTVVQASAPVLEDVEA